MFTNKNVSGPQQSSVGVVELISRCLDERCTCSVHVHVRSGDSTTFFKVFLIRSTKCICMISLEKLLEDTPKVRVSIFYR